MTHTIMHTIPEWVKQMNHYAASELKADQARRIITAAATEHKLDAVYALFSGGHDSLTATHIASKHPLFAGVIHIDTGTGIPDTRAFVEQVCKAQGWPLHIGKPATTYEMLLVKQGFPGPAQHSFMYRMLKERPLVELLKGLRKGQRIGLITGARQQESVRRMGHVDTHRKDKVAVWINDIFDWTALECGEYMRTHKLPRNPVKDRMHMSGECFCGSYARPEEKRELEIWYPLQAQKLEAWQTLVRTAHELGLNSIPFNYQQWGHGGGLGKSTVPDAQLELMPMCWFCRGDEVQP